MEAGGSEKAAASLSKTELVYNGAVLRFPPIGVVFLCRTNMFIYETWCRVLSKGEVAPSSVVALRRLLWNNSFFVKTVDLPHKIKIKCLQAFPVNELIVQVKCFFFFFFSISGFAA